MTVIERLENGENLKNLNMSELGTLAWEIREFLVRKVSENGGHLASNLGIVELTIALHYVYDFPDDKVIWDVGHQSYVHKILSGRGMEFDSLRKLGGISGFPKREESEYDCFDTGHASTSISAAIGMAKARELKGEKNNIIAVIGDGSLGGGLAYEAINDVGNSKTKLLIVLNDNKMSISKNVGAMSKHLNSIRTSGKYNRLKQRIVSSLQENEYTGLLKTMRKLKNSIKRALMSNTVFEGLGLTYFGPFDGNNVEMLIKMMKRVKDIDGGVLMHIRTVKGKGYEPAEKEPQNYHGVSSFDYQVGTVENKKVDYSEVFGNELVEIAKNNEKVVAITAAMPEGTGLLKFKEQFPQRFFDVGIAEGHAVTMAAGMAANGLVPVVPVYSTFLQRGFDNILHDVCLQGLHVVFCADRAGIVGADGETHQGVFDLSYMRMMPGITILAPADYSELKCMLRFAVDECTGPVVIRYPRGVEELKINHGDFVPGRADIIKEGTKVCIISCGNMVAKGLKAAEILEQKGISTKVINVRSVKPLDEETICTEVSKAELAMTIEDNVVDGGMGEEVLRILNSKNIKTKVIVKGYKKGKIQHGSPDELMKIFGMDSESIAGEIEKTIGDMNV